MQNANTLKCITSFYFTKSASWYLLHFKDWLRRWTLAQQQKIIFVRLILLTCPKRLLQTKSLVFELLRNEPELINWLLFLPTPTSILGIFIIISSLEKNSLLNLTIHVFLSNGWFMLHWYTPDFFFYSFEFLSVINKIYTFVSALFNYFSLIICVKFVWNWLREKVHNILS